MGYFKFHNAAHTERMLSGSWLVSSLHYFTYLELKSKNQWVGDHTESGIIYRVENEITWEKGKAPPEDTYMRSEGLIAGGPFHAFSLGASTLLKPESPAHIISLCCGEYEPCAFAMLEEPEPPYRYNACIEITDIQGFVQALWEGGRTAANTPLRAIFKQPLMGQVLYGDRQAAVSDQIPLQYGYFWKRSEYVTQREFRIVLPHIEQWAIRDRLTFNIPRPERFLSPRPRLTRTPNAAQESFSPEMD